MGVSELDFGLGGNGGGGGERVVHIVFSILFRTHRNKKCVFFFDVSCNTPLQQRPQSPMAPGHLRAKNTSTRSGTRSFAQQIRYVG